MEKIKKTKKSPTAIKITKDVKELVKARLYGIFTRIKERGFLRRDMKHQVCLGDKEAKF